MENKEEDSCLRRSRKDDIGRKFSFLFPSILGLNSNIMDSRGIS